MLEISTLNTSDKFRKWINRSPTKPVISFLGKGIKTNGTKAVSDRVEYLVRNQLNERMNHFQEYI